MTRSASYTSLTDATSNYDDLYAELSQEPTKFPASPGNIKEPESEPGEEEFIAGPIVEVGIWRSAEYGDSTTVVVRDQKTGLRIHYASPSITRRFFEENPPTVGRELGIYYGGLRQLRGGGHYHHYQCRYVGDGGESELQFERKPPAEQSTAEAAEPEPGDDGIPF